MRKVVINQASIIKDKYMKIKEIAKKMSKPKYDKVGGSTGGGFKKGVCVNCDKPSMNKGKCVTCDK